MPPIRLISKRLLLCTANDDRILASDILNLNIRNHYFWQSWGPILPNNFLTLEVQTERLQKDIEALNNHSAIRFFLLPAAGTGVTDELCPIWGDINFSNIVRGIFQSCHLGYKIDENLRGQGYIVEALNAAINYMFEVEQLHRIEANIMPYNKASIRVVEKLNFTCEGLSRKYLKINGVWEDHLRYVLWNDQV